MSFAQIYRTLESRGVEAIAGLEGQVAQEWWRYLLSYTPYLRLRGTGLAPHSQLLQLVEAHGGASPLAQEARDWLAGEGPSHWWLREVWPPPRPRWLPLVLRGHRDYVLAADFSPNGSLAVSGSRDGTARVWDAQTGECRAVLEHKAEVVAVRISSDSQRVITGDIDGQISLFDPFSGEKLGSLAGHRDGVTLLLRVGDEILSAGRDGSIALWDPHTGALLRRLVGHDQGVWQADVACGRVLSASPDRTVRFWDLETGQCLRVLEGFETPRAASLSRDGRRALAAGAQEARVWDLESGCCLWEQPASRYGTRPAAMTADGRRVVLAEHWGIRIWDIDRGTLLAEGPRGGWPVVVSPDSRYAVTGHNLDTLLFHDLESTPEGVTELTGHQNWISALEFSQDGRKAISGGLDRTLRVWDLENPDHCPHPRDDLPLDSLLAMDPSGTWVASADVAELRVWQAGSGTLRYRFSEHHFSVREVAFAGDSRTMVSVSGDPEPRVWDLATGECRLVLKGHAGSCLSGVVTSDAKLAVSASEDATLRVWDLATGQCAKVLAGHAGPVHRVELAFGGRIAVSGSNDETIRIWSLPSGHCLHVLKGHSGTISRLAITPDGTRILSCGGDGLRMWDTQSGRLLAAMGDGLGWVNSLTISRDGRRALTAGDSALMLWDLDEVRLLRQMPSESQAAGFLRTDSRAYTVNTDNIVRMWDLRAGECLAATAGAGSALALGDDLLVRGEGQRLRRLALCSPGQIDAAP